MKSNRFWFYVLGALLIISVAAALALSQTPTDQAHIYQDGLLVESLDLSGLSQPRSLTVESAVGYNTIIAERGRIRVSEADCPDGLCVRQGWSDRGSVPIVCLPHRLVIRFEKGEADDLDAVVG